MRILSFSSLYPNNVDPSHGIFVERRLRELAKATDIQPIVVSPVPWFPFRSKKFGSYSAMARIAKSDRRFGIDILHPRFPLIPKIGMNSAPKLMALACRQSVQRCVEKRSVALIDAHYFYPDGVAAAILARDLNLPYFITARGSDINLIARYASPRKQMLKAAAGASALIAVSDALADAMRDLGMPGDRIHVLRNGVDLDFFSPGNRENARRVLSLSQITYLSVGALKGAKGHDIAIEFVAGVENALLVIVGRGPDEERLRQMARRLGIEHRVIFTGTLGPEELRTWYQAADALILMSKREGMPNVILESLACGTPVLASDVGGIPELLSAAEAGEIARTRNVDGLKEAGIRMSRRGIDRSQTRKFAERYSWADTIRKLSAMMHRSVMGNNSKTKHRIT